MVSCSRFIWITNSSDRRRVSFLTGGTQLGMGPLGKQSRVCKQLGQENDGQGASMGAEWATSHG